MIKSISKLLLFVLTLASGSTGKLMSAVHQANHSPVASPSGGGGGASCG
ncbi:MAG: hypothetical protein KA715_00295 [Xanthomonadaceae bacterium]|nr:hypothetical protein [Xanthomonadaceae bacterium]